MTDRAEHSPLGGSSVERFGACPGSVALIEQLAPVEERLPEWTADGILAHSLIDSCLRDGKELWELDLADVKQDQINAITLAVEYCRGLPGRHFVEYELSAPYFHNLMYGRLDFATIEADVDGNVERIEIDDYKNGAGIVKEAKRNPQTMYYGFAFIDGLNWPADLKRAKDDCPVRLAIIQPNAWHPDGEIRYWDTTAGEIRAWAHRELKPMMEATARDQYLEVGSHCRFCPAKLVCPAQQNLVKMWGGGTQPGAVNYLYADDLKSVSNERLAYLYSLVEAGKIAMKAIEGEVFARNMDGNTVPGTKLVEGRSNRIWKEGAETAARENIGEKAFKTMLLSPATMEELSPMAKVFTTTYAYKPAGQPVVTHTDDNRTAISPPKGEIVFAGYKQED